MRRISHLAIEPALNVALDAMQDQPEPGCKLHALITLDAAGQITAWQADADLLLGHTAAQVVGRSYDLIFAPEDRADGVPGRMLADARHQGFGNGEHWFVRGDGSRFRGNCLALPRTVEGVPGFVAVMDDRSKQHATEQALRRSEAQFRLLTETIPQLVWQSLDDGNWQWAGPQWCAYTGQSESDSHGHGWQAMVHPDDQPATMRAWHAAVERGGFEVEHRMRRADGEYRWFQSRATPLTPSPGSDATRTWFGTSTDVDGLRRAEEHARFLAYHDPLTKAANRAQLEEILREVMRDGAPGCCLLYLDLDGFKAVNDHFGHRGGDELLCQFTDRLRACLGEGNLLARTGGDEFVVVQRDPDLGAAMQLAENIVAVIAPVFTIGGSELRCRVSIGVAQHPGDGSSPDDLMRRADLAMYSAKAQGGGCVRLYEPEMEAGLRRRQALERDLAGAIGRGELQVHYQPIFHASTRALQGFEALARWTHPRHGAVSPATFVPLAEECGLIINLGAWVLERACAAAASWGGDELVAVNISPAQLRHGDLAALVTDVLARTGLSPARLELEVTESLMLEDSDVVSGALEAIKAMGVRIALDDFGTGYSSLGTLCRIPFDRVKIDQSFVRRMEQDDNARVVVQAVTALGHSLRLDVTAEGVETETQFALLRSIGCDQAQGFLLGRPTPNPVAVRCSAANQIQNTHERLADHG